MKLFKIPCTYVGTGKVNGIEMQQNCLNLLCYITANWMAIELVFNMPSTYIGTGKVILHRNQTCF